MDIEYIKKNYRFSTLTDNHDLSAFKCSSNDLNDFLKSKALIQQKEKLNVTKLIMINNIIVGFVSLLTDTISLKNIRDENIKQEIKNLLVINNPSEKRNLPAIKIGRFAVDEKYSNNGLGSEILMSVLFNIKEISENYIGLRFVTVDAYAIAYKFYTKFGFNNLKKDNDKINKIDKIIERDPKHTFCLYLDLKVLE